MRRGISFRKKASSETMARSAPGMSGVSGWPPVAMTILSAVIFSPPTSRVWVSRKWAWALKMVAPAW